MHISKSCTAKTVVEKSVGSASSVCTQTAWEVSAADVQLPHKCKYINQNVKKYTLFPPAFLLRSIKRT